MRDGDLPRSTHVPSFAEYFYGDESMTIIVYSTPTCVQSRATTHALEARGIAFEEIDLTQDNEAHRAIEAMGYRRAPVVVADRDHWTGFRPDRIGALVLAT